MQTGFLEDLLPATGDVVAYSLVMGGHLLPISDWLFGRIELRTTGRLACVFCGRPVKKLFPNGSCYPCFRDLPQNDLCIVKPNQCHYETCRDQAWGDRHCQIPTYLYVAASSGIKVGISRNIPGRWMQQGASRAMKVARLPTRKLAGDLEALLAQRMKDKTNWRKMLQGDVDPTPLATVVAQVREWAPAEFRPFFLDEQLEQTFRYPGRTAPERVVSLNLETAPVAGTLVGLRGQYLIIDTGASTHKDGTTIGVLPVPKYAGFEVSLQVDLTTGQQAGD